MKKLSVLIVVMLGSSYSYARDADPYVIYMHSVRQHQVAPGIKDFAEACGYSIAGNRPIYGVNLDDKWKLTRNPTRRSADQATDFFSIAEIWMQGKNPRIVNIWSIEGDVGSELNLMYCLDDTGRVRFIESKSISIPVVGPLTGWNYERRIVWDTNGQVHVQGAHFVDLKARNITPPKLEPDEMKSLDEIPNRKLAREIVSALLPRKSK